MRYLVLALALSVPTIAAAQPYVAAQGGITLLQDTGFTTGTTTYATDFDAGINVAVKGGYEFGPLRVEGEIQVASNDLDAADYYYEDAAMGSVSFLLNGIYAFLPSAPIHPYVGAGIGFANVGINNARAPRSGAPDDYIDDEDIVFAYQLIVGAEYNLFENGALYAGYHYLATSDPEFEGRYNTYTAEYVTHNIAAGFRYSF